MNIEEMEAEAGYDLPWNRSGWTGDLVSLDDCPAHDFTREDVAEVCAWGINGGRWDGVSSGVVRLRDGRFVAWESWWDATGSGFHCDAYGGTADIAFAADLETAKRYVSEKAREMWVPR